MEEIEVEKTNKKHFWEEHPKSFFWVRFVLWVICGAVLPFLFIALRFNIFKKASSLSLSGWGIIAVLIVAIFILVLIRYLKKGFGIKNVFISQCLNGFTKVIIPLGVLLVIVYISSKNLEALSQSLGCTTLCELIAIPVNPMPEWVEKCRKEENKNEQKDTIDYMTERLFKKKNEGK